MTPDGSIFTSKQGIRTSVTVANGEMVRAQCIGDVAFKMDGQTIRMTELDANLLSISALNRNKLSILFEKDGVQIRRGSNIVASGILNGKMYYLHSFQTALISIEDAENSEHTSAPKDSEAFDKNVAAGIEASQTLETRKLTLYQLWHACMGHFNPKRLGSLFEHVTGIDSITLPTLQNLDCTVCNFSNKTRIVNRDTTKRAERKLGRVHTDVWGPYRVLSIGVHSYFLSLLDDLTRKSWLIPMKFRKEIYRHVSEWETAIGLQTGEKVAIYQCNNAKEYQRFEKLVHDNGTRIEYTPAYTPEENGVAERFNRTIVQMARAILVWSKLTQKFWAEAVCTANYLRNLLPSGQDDLSPNELWNGHKPNVIHIRILGMRVRKDRASGTITLDQSVYIKNFL